jgi:hypothetical protein
MAHATDYQSRPRSNWDQAAFLRGQVKAAIKDKYYIWSERALWEYCEMAYKDAGLTHGMFDQLYLEHTATQAAVTGRIHPRLLTGVCPAGSGV